jgi:GTP pyrophosphokinase
MLLPDASVAPKQRFAIEISAHDRAGLLLDVTSCLRDAGVSLDANSGSTDAATQIARIAINVQLAGLTELLVLVDALRQIPDVIDARRIELQRSS